MMILLHLHFSAVTLHGVRALIVVVNFADAYRLKCARFHFWSCFELSLTNFVDDATKMGIVRFHDYHNFFSILINDLVFKFFLTKRICTELVNLEKPFQNSTVGQDHGCVT